MINVAIFGWGIVLSIGVIIALVGSVVTAIDLFSVTGEYMLEIGTQIVLVCVGVLVVTGIMFLIVNILKGSIPLP